MRYRETTEPVRRPPVNRAAYVDSDVYDRVRQRREMLANRVDIPLEPARVTGVSRLIFQTVWRTPTERGTPVKVSVSNEKIIVARVREAIPNPFLEVDSKSKKRPIDQFADGKTYRIDLADGEALSGTIERLRVAAKSLEPAKGVRVAYDGGDRKAARGFRFELIPFVARQPKAETPAA